MHYLVCTVHRTTVVHTCDSDCICTLWVMNVYFLQESCLPFLMVAIFVGYIINNAFAKSVNSRFVRETSSDHPSSLEFDHNVTHTMGAEVLEKSRLLKLVKFKEINSSVSKVTTVEQEYVITGKKSDSVNLHKTFNKSMEMTQGNSTTNEQHNLTQNENYPFSQKESFEVLESASFAFIKRPPEKFTAIEGTIITFECIPNSTVMKDFIRVWSLPPKVPILSIRRAHSKKTPGVIISSDQSKLTIQRVRLVYAGQYSCLVTGSGNTASAVMNLDVIVSRSKYYPYVIMGSITACFFLLSVVIFVLCCRMERSRTAFYRERRILNVQQTLYTCKF